MKFRILELLLYIFAPASAMAQSSVDYDVKSLFANTSISTPEMAKMVRNIVYPVNYSTGLVDITIPLYEIKCADISLPISLKYHASGVKLGEGSGSVGQGWSLSCEPMISKKTRGRDDRFANYKCDVDLDNSNPWNYYYMAVCNKDGQPDEYYFSLPEYQGEFMYVMESKNSGKKFMCLPYQNLKISQESANNWRITDDKGRQYLFEDIRESYGDASTGWKATGIVASNHKDSIKFSYFGDMEHSKFYRDYIVVIDDLSDRMALETNREKYRNLEGINYDCNAGNAELMCPLRDYWMQDPAVYSFVYDNTIGGRYTQTYQSDNNGNLFKDTMSGTFDSDGDIIVMGKKLQDIVFPGGRVSFLYTRTSGVKLLSKIEIYNHKELVRTISFDMEHIASQNRNFLNGISVFGAEGKVCEKYTFEYYEKYRLPKVGNKSIDFWGYYNGVNRKDTTTLVPYQTITTTRSSRSYNSQGRPTGSYDKDDDFKLHIGSQLSREADEEYMRFGTLKSITYPAGSKDVFEYECHHYRDANANNNVRLAGGLRIKSIVTYNLGKVQRTRSFTYGADEDGCGFSPMSSDLEHFVYERQKQYIEPVVLWSGSSSMDECIGYLPNQVISARHRTFFCNPILPNTFSNGSSVMYDYVTEYNGTPENNSGKTIYHYSVNTDTLTAPVKSTAQCDSKQSWKYGHLIGKSVYKKVGEAYKLVEQVENVYDTDIPKFGTVRTLEVTLNNLIEGNGNKMPELVYDVTPSLTDVEIGAKVLREKRESNYDDQGRWITKTTSYGYKGSPSYLVNDVVTEKLPGGSDIITQKSYPVDFSDALYGKMQDANMFPVVGKDVTIGNEKIKTSTPYQEVVSGVYVPKCMEIVYPGDSKAKQRIQYRYDSYGNKIEEVKDGKEYVAYLYGYNHQYIVARIENASYSDVFVLLGETVINGMASSADMDNWTDKLEELRSKLTHSHIYTYTYDPLVGITSVKEPNGNLVHYEYDELGRLSRTFHIVNGRTEVLSRYQYHYKTEK